MANEFLQPTVAMGAQQSAHPETTFSWDDSYQKYSYVALVGFTLLLLYSFWNMFEGTSKFWEDAQYSHGYLIPLIALYLMWSRRPNPQAQEPHEGQAEETFLGLMPASQAWQGAMVASLAMMVGGWYAQSDLLQGAGLGLACVGTLAYVLVGQPFRTVTDAERWTGLAIIAAAYGLRMLAAQWDIVPVDRIAFVIALAGLFYMVGGMHLITWAGPAVAFSVFMFPIPSMIEKPLLGQLQTLASIGSEIILTILNIPMVRQGNKILLDGVQDLTVAEECSGLRMLTVFLAMSVAMVFLIRRPWWDKFIILLSALPIALAVNILRIVVTALLFYAFPENERIHRMVHDVAGWGMIFVAIGMLYFEMKVLSMLSVPEEGVEARSTGLATGAH